MSNSSAVLGLLNARMEHAYDQGEPFEIVTTGGKRAELEILSLRPLVYEKYGHIRNRGPRLAGVLAIRAVMWQECEAGTRVFGVLPTETATYGLTLPPNVVNDAFEWAGIKGARFVPREPQMIG